MYYWQRQIETRQRSLIASTILTTLLCVGFVLGMIYILFKPGAELELEWREYVVQPGDTLWSIAVSHVKSQPVDKTVYQIRQKNSIDPIIRPGQVLLVPHDIEVSKAVSSR